MKRIGSLGLLVCATAVLHAQNDGDHTITNPGGQTYMATDGIATSTPVNLTVGTTPNFNATLNVRGDQLPVNSSVYTGLCTFRTDVASGVEQGWEMWRDINQIGRIWHYGLNGPLPGGHRALHIQSMKQGDDVQDRYSDFSSCTSRNAADRSCPIAHEQVLV